MAYHLRPLSPEEEQKLHALKKDWDEKNAEYKAAQAASDAAGTAYMEFCLAHEIPNVTPEQRAMRGGPVRYSTMNHPAEKKLTESQLNGISCVVCGRRDLQMVPIGCETSTATEVFRCDSPQCYVEARTVKRWIEFSESKSGNSHEKHA